jgi:anti-sigma factor RsiW
MHNSEANMIDDADLQLLEAMLDSELPAQQSEALAARLSKEPRLLAALEHLRSERKLREEMFSSLEGGEEPVVEKILANVGPALPDIARRPAKFRLRYAMAAAACVVIGFLIGWMGATGGRSNVSASEAPYRVEILDETGQVMAVQKFQSLEKAREFSNDLQQWQIRQERILNGQVTVHSAKY